MDGFEMKVTAWNNGKHHASGAGYGLKVQQASDRDRYFRRKCSQVFVALPRQTDPVKINIDKDSFWNGCRELISRDIGKWLRDNGYAPWKSGHPPKFQLKKVGERNFELSAT